MAMNKLDRMSVSESTLAEDTIDDIKGEVVEIVEHMEAFEEARTEAEGAFSEAASYHEDREWEDRDGALENANDYIGQMENALAEIEDQSIVNIMPERLDSLKKMVAEVRNHIDNLV